LTEIAQRARLFVGSYAGLFAILAIRFDATWLRWACIVLAVLGVALMAWVVFVVPGQMGAEPITAASVEDAGSDVAGYLATYLLPFLTVAEPGIRDVVAYALFLGISGLIYVRSEMTQINPTLYVLGRQVVKLTTDQGWTGYVVARGAIHVDDVVRSVPMNEQVRVQVRDDRTQHA